MTILWHRLSHITYVHYALIAVLTAMVMGLGFLCPPAGDDFCNFMRVHDDGVINAITTIYMEWSGRLVTTGSFAVLFAVIPLENSNLISVCLGILWTAICIIASNQISQGQKSEFRIVAAGIFISIFWLLLGDLTGQTIFWNTGGVVYLIPLFLLVATKGVLNAIFQMAEKRRIAAVLLAFTWCISLGNGIELLVIPASFLVSWMAYKHWNRSGNSRDVSFAALLGLAIGILALLAAPGNFNRAAYGAKGFSVNAISLIKNYAFILSTITDKYYFAANYYIQILTLVTVLCFSWLLWRRRKRASTSHVPIMPLGLAWFYLAIGYMLYAPLAAVPDFLDGRVTIYFAFFLVASYLMFGRFIISVLPAHPSVPWLGRTVLICCFTAFLFTTYPDFAKAARIKQAVALRSQDAILHRGQKITVPPIVTADYPKHLYIRDVEISESFWVNQCVSRYYHLEAISRGF